MLEVVLRCVVVAIAVSLAAPMALADDGTAAKPRVIASFEPTEPHIVQGPGKIVREQATDGEFSLRLENPGHGYVALSITDPATLRLFQNYVLLRVDVFNPQDKPVTCTMRVDDAQSHDYGSRYNDDGVIVRPGRSTLELNLSGLTRSNARNFSQRGILDRSALKLWGISFHATEPTVLFFDNIRLEGSGLPQVSGLRAFDFGPSGSPVYPGFEGVTEKSVYSPEAGFGWIGPERHENVYTPDALTGDWGSGNEFRIDLPNGRCEVQLCMDAFGTFARYPTFSWRRLKINGAEVFTEKRTAAEFLDRYYFAHEDQEDLPGEDVWDKFVAPRNIVRQFTAEVTDGAMHIVPQSDSLLGRCICFVVVYPEERQEAGRHFMEALQSQRKARYNDSLVVRVEAPSGSAPVAAPADVQRGFIPFIRRTEEDIPLTYRPTAAEIGKPIALEAARGERAHGQVGLYPLAVKGGVHVTAGDLVGPGGSRIPGSSISIRKIRNFLRRVSQTTMARIQPMILQPFADLDVQPGVTRGLWLNITVPADAAPGDYHGMLQIGPASGGASIPITLTVFPFALDKVTDTTLSVTGATASQWRGAYPELEALYWQNADLVMQDMADHGMNAVTGGPGSHLIAVRDGHPVIDYTDMDRWLALAVKHGLTMPGDSYQGLEVQGLPLRRGLHPIEASDTESRRRFGIGFKELVGLVYADVGRHAREKGWPPRVYALLDEPRPEHHDIESSEEIAKLFTAAAPDTLFSGYYSTGSGRDPYFQTMPVSICHTDAKSVQLTHDAGKQLWDYKGGGGRYDIGRWAFFASRRGLKGFMRNGYMYVASDPYFDFSDDEASWCVVYPSRHGVKDTVGWERTAQGADDFRYLATLDRLIRQATAAHPAGAEAAAAQAYLTETFKSVKLESKESARLAPEQFDAFRHAIAEHIIALTKAAGG